MLAHAKWTVVIDRVFWCQKASFVSECECKCKSLWYSVLGSVLSITWSHHSEKYQHTCCKVLFKSLTWSMSKNFVHRRGGTSSLCACINVCCISRIRGGEYILMNVCKSKSIKLLLLNVASVWNQRAVSVKCYWCAWLTSQILEIAVPVEALGLLFESGLIESHKA